MNNKFLSFRFAIKLTLPLSKQQTFLQRNVLYHYFTLCTFKRMLSPTASKHQSDFPYVPKPEHIDAINEYCEVDFELLQGSPSPKKNGKKGKKRHRHHHSHTKNHTVFTVVGESGSGKTSLLKYWSDQRKIKARAMASGQPGSPGSNTQQEFIFYYGVNSSRDAQLSNMLGKLEAALKFHFQLRELLVRKSSAHRRWDLVRYLESSAKKSRTPIVIVIDGLSRLKMESGVEADPMLWLPRDLPNKVRFIVSLTEYEVPPVEESDQQDKTRNSSQDTLLVKTIQQTQQQQTQQQQQKTASFIELERRKTPCLRLGVLSLETRRQILSTYAKYHRNAFDLTDDKVMQILASQGSGHPLYLRVLLNSLRTAARLSCIPAIAVGVLLDSVMESEMHGWSHDAWTETVVEELEEVDTIASRSPRSRGSLTWEERQQTMSRGALSTADKEVAGLVGSGQRDHQMKSVRQKSKPVSISSPSSFVSVGGATREVAGGATGGLPSSVEMVISLALRRCEEDVEMEMDGSDTGLLGSVLSLLYVSHHGLTENELLGCVALAAQEEKNNKYSKKGKGQQSVPPPPQKGSEKFDEWHENFQNQFEQHRETLRLILDDICMVVRAVDSSVAGVTDSDMVNQSDVRVIMEHESVRRVVWRQYLGSSYAEKNRNHEMLAKYFEKIVPVCPRRIEELPWHYEQLQHYGMLRDTVTNIDMFRLWWGDSRMEFYRSELIRVWSVLCMPPVGLDLVEEIRNIFEAQIMARHMRDDAISTLMLQVAELTIAFQRSGWESGAGLDCPIQRHPSIPLADLVQNGVPVLLPDPEGEENGEVSQFIELIKTARHSLEDGPMPTINSETVGFIGEHYYYSRWMWAQFPLILLGFSDMYSQRVAAMAAAKSMSVGAAKESPARRDPIILRLKQLAHKLENPDLHLAEEKGKSKKKKTNIDKNTTNKNTNKKKKINENKEQEIFMTNTTCDNDSKDGDVKNDDAKSSDAGDLKKNLAFSLESDDTPTRSVQEVDEPASSQKKKEKQKQSSPMLAAKSKPHPNSPFLLDVHAGDRHEHRLESMTGSIMKQRRVLNAMVIKMRSKKKVMKKIREELTVLDSLSKGEEVSLGSAMELVSELDATAARIAEVDTLSNFYRLILQTCKAYSADQPEWLAVLDEEIELGRRNQNTTKELIAAVIEQRRDILSLLSEARTTQYHRRGVLSQMLDRLEFQHAKELENVQNEKQWKQRQAMLLREDIVQENRLKMQHAEDERKAIQAQNEQRRHARDSKLAIWRDRVQRLKDSTGVSSIDEMLVLVASRSQLNTKQNLTHLVNEEETKIATLTLQKEQLRNDMMKLRFSYNHSNQIGSKSYSGDAKKSPKGKNGITPSFQKQEFHAIAEKEVAVQRAKAQVEQVRRELDRVNKVVMNVKVGLEHITRMCGVNYSDAEKAREEESKQPKMYFEVTEDISARDRASSTIDLLVKVEANLVGKIADIQRLAPRTPKSRNRKRRKGSRRSNSREGRGVRRSQSRDGRVGSPLR